ncbi:sigma factor-like helix-turn-helix DNA-binding protein [Nocardia cyriacigeorgica]|uniref:sigma factor-like helix-turn-helix DNA-binding protein n=1 Tax=Nocardia cyriacigeorgica TaxID=135487 RepID=UPI002455C6AE|nr:sigma factor-like helix-turn-helix DNA-binding protein [Nocardia cyriacigeorgica]
MGSDEFEQVRSEPDPVRRGRRATELITRYQQRAVELARIRKEAIEEAYRKGLSYTEIAELFGITKGRISQIRSSAPPAERAFFGVGPVAVGIPRRSGVEDGRDRSFFDASDEEARERVEGILAELSLATSRFAIEPDAEEIPEGDAVVICGPKSAPVARSLLDADDALEFEQIDGTWCIVEKATGKRYESPHRADSAHRTDIAYLGRRGENGRVVVQIAGVTSVGSLGVAHWLSSNLSSMYDPAAQFTSAVIECDFDAEMSITDSRTLAGPFSTPE